MPSTPSLSIGFFHTTLPPFCQYSTSTGSCAGSTLHFGEPAPSSWSGWYRAQLHASLLTATASLKQ